MMNLPPDVLETIERVKREGIARRSKGIQGRFAKQHKVCSDLSGTGSTNAMSSKDTNYQDWVMRISTEHLGDEDL